MNPSVRKALQFLFWGTLIALSLRGFWIFVLIGIVIISKLFPRFFNEMLPLSNRMDLYENRHPESSKAFSNILWEIRNFTKFYAVPLPAPEALLKNNDDTSPLPQQAEAETPAPPLSGSVSLTMPPHIAATGVYRQEGEDRIFYITEREVTDNPFFRKREDESVE